MDFISIARNAFASWRKDDVPELAAAISYYSLFSLSPLLVILIVIISFFIRSSTVYSTITQQVQSLLGHRGAELIGTVMQNAEQPHIRTASSVISIVVLLIGATGLFSQLQHALDRIFIIKEIGGIAGSIKKRALSFAILLAIGFLLLVSMTINTAISALSGNISSRMAGWAAAVQIANVIVSVLVTTVLFALIYKVLPDADLPWKNTFIGALVGAVLFEVGRAALGIYLGRTSPGSVYGAAGSLIIILLWVYYSSQILLFGAEFTKVYTTQNS